MKDNKTYGFNKPDAEALIGMIGTTTGTAAIPSIQRRAPRYAKITEGDGEGRYSWVAVGLAVSGSGPVVGERPAWGEGSHEDDTGFAVDMLYQCKHVIPDSIVEIMAAPGDVQAVVFNYQPSAQRVLIEDDIAAGSVGTGTLYKWGTSSWVITDHEIPVRNTWTNDVLVGSGADAIVDYVQGQWEISSVNIHPSEYVRFELTGGFAGGSASADFFAIDGTPIGSGSLVDPEGVAAEMEDGFTGYAIRQNGVYVFVQAKCNQGEEE